MPTYVYESIPCAGEKPDRFEFEHRMSDPPLTQHPETGVSLRRVLTAPFIIGLRSSVREAAAREKDDANTKKSPARDASASESEGDAAIHCSDCDGEH